jgi:hypothetical protein
LNPKPVSVCNRPFASASTWDDFGSTAATAIQACLITGSVFGSPGLKEPAGVEAGADDEVGGGVGLGGGVGEGDGMGLADGEGLGDGEGDGGAVLAHTFSDRGPVSPFAVALSRKQTSVFGLSLVTV